VSGEGGRAGGAGAGDALGRRRVAGAAEAGINMQADEPAVADMHLSTRMATGRGGGGRGEGGVARERERERERGMEGVRARARERERRWRV
jgi:hypothetical protein